VTVEVPVEFLERVRALLTEHIVDNDYVPHEGLAIHPRGRRELEALRDEAARLIERDRGGT
jgi:hypothetical protein